MKANVVWRMKKKERKKKIRRIIVDERKHSQFNHFIQDYNDRMHTIQQLFSMENPINVCENSLFSLSLHHSSTIIIIVSDENELKVQCRRHRQTIISK